MNIRLIAACALILAVLASPSTASYLTFVHSDDGTATAGTDFAGITRTAFHRSGDNGSLDSRSFAVSGLASTRSDSHDTQTRFNRDFAASTSPSPSQWSYMWLRGSINLNPPRVTALSFVGGVYLLNRNNARSIILRADETHFNPGHLYARVFNPVGQPSIVDPLLEVGITAIDCSSHRDGRLSFSYAIDASPLTTSSIDPLGFTYSDFGMPAFQVSEVSSTPHVDNLWVDTSRSGRMTGVRVEPGQALIVRLSVANLGGPNFYDVLGVNSIRVSSAPPVVIPEPLAMGAFATAVPLLLRRTRSY